MQKRQLWLVLASSSYSAEGNLERVELEVKGLLLGAAAAAVVFETDRRQGWQR